MATATLMEEPPAAIALTQDFYITTGKRAPLRIQVKLTDEGIYLRRDTPIADHISEQLLHIEDIVGSRYGGREKRRARGGLTACRSPQAADGGVEEERQMDATADTAAAAPSSKKDTSAYLYIYAYVKTEQPARRTRNVRILRFRNGDSYAENLAMAAHWHAAIKLNRRRRQRLAALGERPLLVLLNPKSGSGRGRELFQKQVAPLLKEAQALYEVHVTTHANNARELVRRRTDLLQRYSAIVVASGDGLFYEVLNGLLERPDWRKLSEQLPLGILPCGSGNGLAKTIAHLYGEPYEPKPILHAALGCLAGNYAPMDVVRVQMGSGAVCYSFLAVGWGLIADIDIESERLRSIGATRFTLWSLHRVLSLRTHSGKLYYLPWRKEEVAKTAQTATTEQDASPLFQDSVSVSGSASDDSDNVEFADIASLRPAGADSWQSAYSKRTAYYSIAGQSNGAASSQRTLDSAMARRIAQANEQWEANAPPSTLLPLDVPLADDDTAWQCIAGEFVMVHTSCSTHIAADCHFAPQSRLDDGIIYVVIILAGIPRAQLAQFLLNMSSGTHLPAQPNEFVRVVAARAFRIEPADGDGADGIMTVDGERVPYGPIQCEVLPRLVNVLVPHDRGGKVAEGDT